MPRINPENNEYIKNNTNIEKNADLNTGQTCDKGVRVYKGIKKIFNKALGNSMKIETNDGSTERVSIKSIKNYITRLSDDYKDLSPKDIKRMCKQVAKAKNRGEVNLAEDLKVFKGNSEIPKLLNDIITKLSKKHSKKLEELIKCVIENQDKIDNQGKTNKLISSLEKIAEYDNSLQSDDINNEIDTIVESYSISKENIGYDSLKSKESSDEISLENNEISSESIEIDPELAEIQEKLLIKYEELKDSASYNLSKLTQSDLKQDFFTKEVLTLFNQELENSDGMPERVAELLDAFVHTAQNIGQQIYQNSTDDRPFIKTFEWLIAVAADSGISDYYLDKYVEFCADPNITPEIIEIYGFLSPSIDLSEKDVDLLFSFKDLTFMRSDFLSDLVDVSTNENYFRKILDTMHELDIDNINDYDNPINYILEYLSLVDKEEYFRDLKPEDISIILRQDHTLLRNKKRCRYLFDMMLKTPKTDSESQAVMGLLESFAKTNVSANLLAAKLKSIIKNSDAFLGPFFVNEDGEHLLSKLLTGTSYQQSNALEVIRYLNQPIDRNSPQERALATLLEKDIDSSEQIKNLLKASYKDHLSFLQQLELKLESSNTPLAQKLHFEFLRCGLNNCVEPSKALMLLDLWDIFLKFDEDSSSELLSLINVDLITKDNIDAIRERIEKAIDPDDPYTDTDLETFVYNLFVKEESD